MTLKQRLFSNLFLRNMLADFGSRSSQSVPGYKFIAYFEYKISPYQPDQFLYFSKQPLAGTKMKSLTSFVIIVVTILFNTLNFIMKNIKTNVNFSDFYRMK